MPFRDRARAFPDGGHRGCWLKRSGESRAIDLVGRLADWLPLGVMARISQLSNRAVNMIVTNVPGPRVPVYMLRVS